MLTRGKVAGAQSPNVTGMARVDSTFRTLATAAVFALCALLAATPGAAGTAAATTRTSVQAGVTVKVTPVAMLPGEWLFAVVLDTETGALDDALDAQSELVAGPQQLKAVQWDGAAPGGQHREGVLTFKAPQGDVPAFEVHVRRKGEAAVRVFRWERAELQ